MPASSERDGAVERRVGLRGADRHAEPDGADRARGGGDALDRLRDAAVLRDLRAREDADEHGRPDRDPAGREQRARGAPPHAPPGERDHVRARDLIARPAGGGSRRVFVLLPQIVIEHQFEERLREWS